MDPNLEQYGDLFSDDEKEIIEGLYSKLNSLIDKIQHCDDGICEQDQTSQST